MLKFKIFLPTVWYFSKRLIFYLSLFVLVYVGVCFRLDVYFPFMIVFNGVFGSFSFECLAYFLILLSLIILAFLNISRIIFVFFCISCFYLFVRKIMNGFRILSIAGKLGSGKSLIMSFLSLLIADINFQEKRFLYLLYYGKQKAENPAPFKNEQEKERFKVIKETVEFYYSHPNLIPELISSYAIKRGDQFSSVLNFDSFVQNQKLPEGAVIAQDESADILGNKRCKASRGTAEYEENKLLDETLSKLRHFYDAFGIFAEQDNMENHIGLRRVVNVNWFLIALSKICTPTAYIKRLERLKQKVLNNSPTVPYNEFKRNKLWEQYYKTSCTLKQAKKYDKLTAKIKKIGFFKINYEQVADKERISSAKVKQSFLILPINLPFEYETRNQFFQNNALSLPLDLQPHTSLYINSPTK